MKHRRHAFTHAFTLVEILAVIAVIAILLSILFLAFGDLGPSAKRRQTRVALSNLNAMQTEFETTGGNIKEAERIAFGNPPPPNTVRLRPAPNFGFGTDAKIAAGQSVVIESRAMLAQFARNAKVKDQLDKRGPEFVLDLKGTGGDPHPAFPRPSVDAWGSPIIYVPAGGLSGLKIGDSSDWIMTSTGSYQGSVPPAQATLLRGFWASPGKDGNFQTGDDNLYSHIPE